jgi:CBS-domain-containing membrane protein
MGPVGSTSTGQRTSARPGTIADLRPVARTTLRDLLKGLRSAIEGFIHVKLLDHTGLVQIICSFGASAVLICGAIRSPLAQLRNLITNNIPKNRRYPEFWL